ncbi:MAG TPA: galactonate dehydratase [Pirellulales bacterium]|jgi:galactonate dehydratase|nr:galactonate dehydratase [Pirellulales bacterium]
MKITAIQTHVCHARMRNWIFVKVLTDQAGLWGWGEATLEWHTRSVVGAIEDLATLVVGEDPTRIEHVWQMMTRQHFWHPGGVVRATATSGIDMALWDIVGKIHSVPCHKLWGGPVRDFIRTYCHLGGGKMEDFYTVDPADAPRFGELAARAVADGFTAFKSMAVPPMMPIEGLPKVRYAEACVRAMRDAVGEAVDIMVDCHARPSPRMGLILAKALEPFGLYWLEEPCWSEDVAALADIRQAVKTPIATGERLTGLDEFRDLLAGRAASIIQPDVTHCGGLTAARRIAALAEAHHVAVAPHNPQGPVSTAASLELGFATPSYLICEAVHLDVPWRQDIVREGFTVEPKGRVVRPGSLPGLGIDIDEVELRKHPFEQEIVLREFNADGSVGDW